MNFPSNFESFNKKPKRYFVREIKSEFRMFKSPYLTGQSVLF